MSDKEERTPEEWAGRVAIFTTPSIPTEIN
jgi:hypothetical protein